VRINPSKLLSTKQAAARVGADESTIRKACVNKRLHHVKLGSNYYTTQGWLDDWQADEDAHKHDPQRRLLLRA
jgi:excisionase family DNA binding protein